MSGFWSRRKHDDALSVDAIAAEMMKQVEVDAAALMATIDSESAKHVATSSAIGVVAWHLGPKELSEVLRELEVEPRRDYLDEQVEVVGETFHVKGIKKVFRGRQLPITASGTTIEDADCVLIPEPWNPHDANAVAVMVDGHQVGYLPAELAVDYADSLGQFASERRLVSGEARIWAKAESGTMIRARVTICIPEAEELER